MQTLGRNYVGHVHARYRRTGTLWEGRYKSCLVDSEEYVLACYRFIEMNPVRARITATPAEYRWSSHRCNALGAPDRLMRPHPQYLALAGVSMPAQQKTLGSARFQAQIEAVLGRHVQVRPAHRPRRAQVF